MVDNTKDNKISKIDAKKRLNTLKIIKNLEIKHRRLIPGWIKRIIKFIQRFVKFNFNWQNTNVIKRWKRKIKRWKWKWEWEWEWNEDDDDDGDDDDDDDETMDQNETKNLNDNLDEIIDKSKLFEDQIKSIQKVKNLEE